MAGLHSSVGDEWERQCQKVLLLDPLSERELEVLSLIAQGDSNSGFP